jgi:hypothetical protein
VLWRVENEHPPNFFRGKRPSSVFNRFLDILFHGHLCINVDKKAKVDCFQKAFRTKIENCAVGGYWG